MGTPEFAVPCLEMIVKEGYIVPAVITQPDRPKGRGQRLAFSPIKEAALKYEIPVLQPQKLKDDKFQDELVKLQPDMIVVVAYGQLLPKRILELPSLGCINVHASLLPSYRGAAPIHWSVINGDTTTGVTTMFMDVGMDTGDMILKAEISIEQDETTGVVHDKLKDLGANVLQDTMERIVNGQILRIPQQAEEATYAPLLTRELEKINWNSSATQIHNLIRGLNPWPGAYCSYKERSLKIWKSRVCNGLKTVMNPGQIHSISNDGFIVATSNGFIEILEVQPESKRKMTAKEYSIGYGLNIGDILI